MIGRPSLATANLFLPHVCKKVNRKGGIYTTGSMDRLCNAIVEFVCPPIPSLPPLMQEMKLMYQPIVCHSDSRLYSIYVKENNRIEVLLYKSDGSVAITWHCEVVETENGVVLIGNTKYSEPTIEVVITNRIEAAAKDVKYHAVITRHRRRPIIGHIAYD